MRGRKPKPKKAQAANSDAVKIVPTRPKELMGKPVALAEWKRIVIELQSKGLWDKTDRALIMLYCDAFQDFSEAASCVKEHGPLVPDKGGGLKSNPAYRQKRDAADRMARYLGDMGLTAVGAIRVGVNQETDDVFDELLKRRNEA